MNTLMDQSHSLPSTFFFLLLAISNYRWNQLDLAIVLLSVMGITLEEIEINASLPINPTIIRIMRVLRIARGQCPAEILFHYCDLMHICRICELKLYENACMQWLTMLIFVEIPKQLPRDYGPFAGLKLARKYVICYLEF